jgi:hypothetical protein
VTSARGTSSRSSGRAKLLILAALAGVVVFLVTRGTPAPAARIDALVPADALLYVHVSTDPEREQDRRLIARARRLPALAPAVRAYEDARPWLGDEAALVVTPRGSAVIADVGNRAKAPRGTYVRGFLVLGDPVVKGPGRAPAGFGDLPAERSADAWVSPRASALLPRALRFLGGRPITATAIPTEQGVRITATRSGEASTSADFEPRLLRALPVDTYAYAGIRGLGVLPELPDVVAPLADVLDGELALSIAPGTDEPVVTLVADVSDPGAVRETLAGLQGTVAAALTGSGEATGQIPVFEERTIGGQDGYVLRLSGGGELAYAVAGDRVVISSRVEGVSRALRDADGLDTSRTFKTAVNDVPETAQALAFVASDQLLELADESGLDAAEAYRAVRPNLARIRALGAVVRRQGNDTTAELTLLIP